MMTKNSERPDEGAEDRDIEDVLGKRLYGLSTPKGQQPVPWRPHDDLWAIIELLRFEPTVGLSLVVDLMAFGLACPADPDLPFEIPFRRTQASRALCEAAREDCVKMLGNPDASGDRSAPIERAYFDTPRILGNSTDSLITDLDVIPMEDFVVAREGRHHSWFNVRVDGPTLVKWLADFAERNEAQVGARDLNAVALDMWYGRKSPVSKWLDKAAAEDYAARVNALTSEERAALNSCLAGEGSPLEAAKALRHRPELVETWPLPNTEFVRTVRALVQLSDVILTNVESGGTPLDQAVFLGHYARRVAFDAPERRANFHERAIAELKSLDAAHKCGSLSRLLGTVASAASLRRCQQCFERPIKQCELRIVEEVAAGILNEQKSDQRRARAANIWNKPVWSVWTVLSWIVFRDWKEICAVEDESEFNAEWLYNNRWKEAEVALLSALQDDRVQAVKDQKELRATDWYGVLRTKPDTWFRQRSVRRCWPGWGEWNGFQDVFWSLGQTILWIVTRDPDDVDRASDDAGRVGAMYGAFAAAVKIEELLRERREQVEDAANDLRRRCQRGE